MPGRERAIGAAFATGSCSEGGRAAAGVLGVGRVCSYRSLIGNKNGGAWVLYADGGVGCGCGCGCGMWMRGVAEVVVGGGR